MAKKHYPAFHKVMMEQAAYPEAPRRIKFDETDGSFVYKTGALVYKVPKPGSATSSLALKEVFLRETAALYRRWAPQLDSEIVPIVQGPGGEDAPFALGGEGTVVDYALKTRQLPDGYWINRLLESGKFNATAAGKVAKFLATQHLAQLEAPVSREEGRPEHLHDLVEELLYQSKKYVGVTVSQPMLDLLLHPIQRFVEEQRKLMLRRQKKGLVLESHGAFVPAHVFIKGADVLAVSPLVGTHKFRTLDAVNDLATFTNALLLAEQQELAEVFVKRYVSTAKDRDATLLLPLYQVLQCLRSGLTYSERQAAPQMDEAARRAAVDLAHRYYALAVKVSREIGRT